MPYDPLQLLLKAVRVQIQDEANRPTFNWTDGINQMSLGIWATGTDAQDQPYLCLGEPDEEMSARTGNGGTIYLNDFTVTGLHHGTGQTSRFDLRKPGMNGEFFVWVAGDWRPENLETAPERKGPTEPDHVI